VVNLSCDSDGFPLSRKALPNFLVLWFLLILPFF